MRLAGSYSVFGGCERWGAEEYGCGRDSDQSQSKHALSPGEPGLHAHGVESTVTVAVGYILISSTSSSRTTHRFV